MTIALTPAILDLIRTVPPAPAMRESLPQRAQPEKWAAPSAIERGQLIDLVV